MIFQGLVFRDSATVFVDHLCFPCFSSVPWCALLSTAFLVSPLPVPPTGSKQWWLWLWPVQNWAGADLSALFGEKESGKEKTALATYPAAEQDGGRLQLLPQGPGRDDLLQCQGLTRVPAAGVTHRRCVFFCCREL